MTKKEFGFIASERCEKEKLDKNQNTGKGGKKPRDECDVEKHELMQNGGGVSEERVFKTTVNKICKQTGRQLEKRKTRGNELTQKKKNINGPEKRKMLGESWGGQWGGDT